MKKIQLKSYVEKIYLLEKTKYEQNLLLDKLKNRANELKSAPLYGYKSYYCSSKIIIEALLLGGFFAIASFIGIVLFYFYFKGADPFTAFLWEHPYSKRELQEIKLLKAVPISLFILAFIIGIGQKLKHNFHILQENETIRTQNVALKKLMNSFILPQKKM